MGELKLCPFCGGEADLIDLDTGAQVMCSSCDAGLISDDWTVRKATESWNARVEDAQIKELKEARNESSKKWREAFDSKDLQCQEATRQIKELREALECSNFAFKANMQRWNVKDEVIMMQCLEKNTALLIKLTEESK